MISQQIRGDLHSLFMPQRLYLRVWMSLTSLEARGLHHLKVGMVT